MRSYTSPEYNLRALFPAVAAQWHPTKNRETKPQHVAPHSNKKFWWLCDTCGREWLESVHNRTSGRGCSACSGRIASDFHSFATCHPIAATEWHPTRNLGLTPSQVTPVSGRQVWWLCSACGHEWKAPVSHRANGGGCPPCAIKRRGIAKATPSSGRSLADLYPDLAAQWLCGPDDEPGLRPDRVKPGSSKKPSWKCGVCGHQWAAVVSSRVSGRGCPACAGKVVTATNNLSARFPDIAAQWHPTRNGTLSPAETLPGSHTKRWWLCRVCGNAWDTAVAHRTTRGSGCPRCAPKKIAVTQETPKPGRSLADLHPQLARQWLRGPDSDPELRPDQVKPGSNRKVSWKCGVCGHQWAAVVSSRVSGRGCPACAGKVVTATNNLSARFPDIAAQWHPTHNGDLRPDGVMPGSRHKRWWLCAECGYEWAISPSIRMSGTGCPPCGRAKSDISRTIPKPGQSFADIRPDLVGEWLRGPDGEEDLRPDRAKPGSTKRPRWKCSTCSHEWHCTVSSRTRGSGCPICAANRTSAREQQIMAELRTYAQWPISDEERVTVAGRRLPYRCDAVIPAWRLIVEYDGWYWHRSTVSRRKDETKTRLLNLAGWKVIRIRENLSAVTNLDVCVADRLGDKEIVNIVAQVIESAANSGCAVPVNAGRYRAIHAQEGMAPAPYVPGRPAPGRSLFECDPKLAAQWHPTKNGYLTPHLVSTRSGKRVWWLCADCGHEWQVMVAHRTAGKGCAKCGRARTAIALAKPSPGRSFADQSPVVHEWHPIRNGDVRPQDVTAFSHTKRWWLCAICGHEWQATPADRSNGYGCLPCGRRRSLKTRAAPNPGRSLSDLHTAVAVQWLRAAPTGSRISVPNTSRLEARRNRGGNA
ncbi:zinc-ribbon domain-containing protein [Mycobacteroides abscessus]|nr:hypothetical protein [Mycobacteroides abscessus]QOF44125.1 hypothetical protein E3G69_003174 [Mycobacteroides abscessus]QOF48824.1 hypothetical protein E3G70_003173 [Mycobacteroides abscessus]